MAKSKKKYYVVWVGQNPGIYDSWDKCREQIAGFPNARYKAFKSRSEAEQAFGQSATDHMNRKDAKNTKPDFHDFLDEIEKDSISVDAACSKNPGIMEYRGVRTTTGEELFRMGPFEDGTNNIGEFLALIHALALLKKQGNNHTAIYTDSRTGLSWLKNKKVKTTLKRTAKNRAVFQLLDRAMHWLQHNDYANPIIKWNTEKWGEIPADFGRK